MQSTHTLTVQRRERTGSRYAKRERDLGRLPAVLYGHGREPVSLSLEAKEAIKFFESGEKVFTIALADESKTQTVLLKDVQFDYLGTNIIHVDLTRVELSDEIESQVPLKFVGEPVGLKTAGALLTTAETSVTVSCSVAALPDEIRLDISKLGAGEHLSASAIQLPEGVKLATDPDTVIVAVEVRSAEAEGEGVDVESGAGEPEVIKEKKDGEKQES